MGEVLASGAAGSRLGRGPRDRGGHGDQRLDVGTTSMGEAMAGIGGLGGAGAERAKNAGDGVDMALHELAIRVDGGDVWDLENFGWSSSL